MPGFENRTLWERVYLHLKAEILEDRLPPGTVIQELPLAASLGVSRGPIREAVGRLAAEGLLTVTPRRGAVVTALSRRELLEAFQVREALEAMAVTLAVPRMTPDDFAELDRLMDEMNDRAARDDVAGFVEANVAFHEALVVASGNAKLHEMYRLLVGQMGAYRRPSASVRGSIGVSIAEHRRIVDAARGRDTQRTVDLITDHIRGPQRRLQALSDAEFVAGAAVGTTGAAGSPGEAGGSGTSAVGAGAVGERAGG